MASSSQPSAPAHPLVEADAFARFFDQRHLAVFRFIYGLHGGPQEEVEDLTAEAFLKAWRGRRSFQGDDQAALSWILRIARNLVIDAHRKTSRRGVEIDLEAMDLPNPASGPEDRVLFDEQTAELLTAVRKLPERQKEIVILRYILDWRVKDIAAHMDMPENTASVILRRALQRIRQNWPKTDG